MWPYPILFILFRPYGFIALKTWIMWISNLSIVIMMKFIPETPEIHLIWNIRL